AKLYGLPASDVDKNVGEMLKRFDLEGVVDALPAELPLGIKQRLSLAAAVIHHPSILILDEPTSGVDPVARDGFWELIIELSRRDKVTVFITTHFMNEAERCDRISLMHAGKSLACDTPRGLVEKRGAPSLEAAFIGLLEEAGDGAEAKAGREAAPIRPETEAPADDQPVVPQSKWFDFQRFYTSFWRELLELRRGKIRTTLAIFGAMILLVVMGYGLNMDVENIDYAVLDQDQSLLSSEYLLGISGSRYFREHAPARDYDEVDRRLKNGELSMVVEIPPGFSRDVQRGAMPQVAYWLDGGEPTNAETTSGYVQALHMLWQQKRAAAEPNGQKPTALSIQNRYRYNPDVKSLPAMVPAVIPILLMMIPAILAALSVVREKELGSIINLYVTPLRRSEFLLGKQLPYVLFAFASSILLILMAVFLFDVPLKGSLPLLLASLFVYCVLSTGLGMLCSSVTRSQIAVIFLAMILTILPAVQLCGLINPVSTKLDVDGIVGHIYPTTYMLLISRGVFNKGLNISELYGPFLIMAAEIVVVCGIGILLQKKQES
ncbi:MAG: ABC transporter ATP-binding protein/permease, partial [Lentisphaeria bacterium]|nr:ABC transporter ATP-binding protein/permease [Lentisphaeria bacterium]